MASVFSFRSRLLPIVLLLSARHYIDAHSWIDCIDTNRAKIYDQSASYIFGGASGNGFCEGYGAGFPGRGDNGIGQGYTYKMLKNEVEAGAPVCKAVDPNSYTDWRKRIALKAGQTAYFAYLPNGHIVKDKKAIGTQHGVYWTGQPGTSLQTTHDIKPERLVNGHTSDYDDGNCGETVDYQGNPGGRAGDGKPCIGYFTIPPGTAPGIYKMVWYWTFWLDDQSAYKDQEMAKGYFGAAYSTCFEVEVKPGGAAAPKAPSAAPTPGLKKRKVRTRAAPMAATPSCTRKASKGDTNVGIEITTDLSCKKGGLGCIDQLCRYCKAKETEHSKKYVECAAIASAAKPGTVSPAQNVV